MHQVCKSWSSTSVYYRAFLSDWNELNCTSRLGLELFSPCTNHWLLLISVHALAADKLSLANIIGTWLMTKIILWPGIEIYQKQKCQIAEGIFHRAQLSWRSWMPLIICLSICEHQAAVNRAMIYQLFGLTSYAGRVSARPRRRKSPKKTPFLPQNIRTPYISFWDSLGRKKHPKIRIFGFRWSLKLELTAEQMKLSRTKVHGSGRFFEGICICNVPLNWESRMQSVAEGRAVNKFGHRSRKCVYHHCNHLPCLYNIQVR